MTIYLRDVAYEVGRVLRKVYHGSNRNERAGATRVGLTINPGLLIHNSNASRGNGDPGLSRRPLI